MEKDWMIQVLDDLKTFADLNGLNRLAGKLDEARDLAQGILSAVKEECSAGGECRGAQSRSHDGEFERHH